jgi:hypothetical protein
VRFVQQYCVAFAFDVAAATDPRFIKPQGDVYEFLRGIRAGEGNDGMVAATASGKLIARLNMDEGIDLQKAHREWRGLPESERAPRAYVVKPDLPGTVEFQDARRAGSFTPPIGALVLKTYTRAFEPKNGELIYVKTGYGQGAPPVVDPFHDFLWLTESEWRSLIPGEAKRGDVICIPKQLVERICRWNLTEASGVSTWRATDLRQADLALTVEEASAAAIRFRLHGSALLASSERLPSPRFYQAQLRGVVEYDRQRESITRFDAVALGPYRDLDAKPDYQRDCLLGVSFELAGSRPQDRVPPRGLAFDQEVGSYFGGK